VDVVYILLKHTIFILRFVYITILYLALMYLKSIFQKHNIKITIYNSCLDNNLDFHHTDTWSYFFEFFKFCELPDLSSHWYLVLLDT